MPIAFDDRVVRAQGTCGVEEAPQLAEWLDTVAEPRLDLKQSTHLHTAIVQALAEAKVPVAVAPEDPFLARWIAPLLPAATPR